MPDSDNIDAPVDAPVDPALAEPTFPASHVHKLNQENAAWRVKFRQAEAELVTLKASAAELVTLRADLKAEKVGSALTEITTKLGARASLVRAVLNDAGTLQTLDPSGADFLPALESLVVAAIEANPELKGQMPSGAIRSGSDGMTTNRAPNVEVRQPIGRDEINTMRAAGRHEDIAKLVSTGQLNHLLSGGM
jgi:hypothetical protein